MKIFKYELPLDDLVTLELPLGSEVLSVGEQNGKVYLWAKFNSATQFMEKRKFKIVGTGGEFDDHRLQYIGTVHERIFVWHIFEYVG